MINTVQGSNLIDINLIIRASNVSERMKVADLGCGSSGFLCFLLAKTVGKSGMVYAVDILKPKLETLERKIKQENLKNIKTIWSNLEIFNATKIEAGSLDAVFLVNTLYQSVKKMEVLRESARLLKKGGKAVIVEWKNISIPFGPPTEERVDIEYIKINCKKQGMSFSEDFTAGDYHYGLIFSKI